MSSRSLHIIHGPGSPISPIDQIGPGPLPEKRYLQPAFFTEGEFHLLLLLERMELMRNYYGSPLHSMAVGMIQDALFKGLHTGIGVGVYRSLPKELNKVANEVIKAKRMIAPVAKVFTTNRLAGLRGGFDPNGPLVNERDCAAIIRDINNPNLPPGVKESKRRQYQECIKFNRYVDGLNDHLSRSSHHLLYSFTDPGKYTSRVDSKAIDHDQAIERIARVVGVSNTVLKGWVHNGVMRSNYEEGGEPLEPKLSVEGLVQKAKEGDHIGDFSIITLIAIVNAVIAAITAVSRLVGGTFTQTEQQQIKNQLPLGTASFGAQYQTDFIGLQEVPPPGENPPGEDPPPGENQPGESSNNLLLGAGVVGLGLLLMNQNQ